MRKLDFDLSFVLLPKDTVEYFVGICVPDSCAGDDVEMLVVSGEWFLNLVIVLIRSVKCFIFTFTSFNRETSVWSDVPHSSFSLHPGESV